MYCPNCGTQIRDGASFCSNCGATITNRQKHKLKKKWIVLISVICVLVVLCAILLPLYFTSPVLPVSSETSDGKSTFTYNFDKKTGTLTIVNRQKGFDDRTAYYKDSPYKDSQWLIALSNSDTPYHTQSLQLALTEESYMVSCLPEYILAHNKYISNGTIKIIDKTMKNLNGSEYDENTQYVFTTKNGKVTKLKEDTSTANDPSAYHEITHFEYAYDEKGRITSITNIENDITETFAYDENGNLESDRSNHNGFGPDYSTEIQNGKMSSYSPTLGIRSDLYSKATFEFSGNKLKAMVLEDSYNSYDGGGGATAIYTSQFKYDGNYITDIQTKIKYDTTYADDEHHLTDSQVTFKYKHVF